MTKIALSALGILALLYVALCAALFFAQRAFIYPAPQGAGPDVAGFERVAYETADGLTLTGGYRAGESGQPVLLFFHGNATTWNAAAEMLSPFGELGFGIFAAEYRGYAGNAGAPAEEGLYTDGRAAMAWLAEQGVNADEVILIGNSLGSGVAMQMASEHDVAGLALISPYSSMTEVVGEKLPWLPTGLLLKDRFESRAKLADISAPVLILHGEQDVVIPVIHADRLAALRGDASVRKFADYGHELVWRPESNAELVRWIATLGADESLRN